MNSKLIFVLALAIFCLNLLLVIDALPAELETRNVVLERLVEAREEADTIDIKRDIAAIDSRAPPTLAQLQTMTNKCESDCNAACAKPKNPACHTNIKKDPCSYYCTKVLSTWYIAYFDNLKVPVPKGGPPTVQSHPRDLGPRDDVERSVEANPPFTSFPTWITAVWILKFNTCMQRCPQACSNPIACPTAQTFCQNWCLKTTPRTSLRRDLAVEEGKSIVRRTDTKSSLKQIASLNATAIAYGTASMNATSALDSNAAAVVMSTIPSDLVPWNTALLRWNECQSICLNFCYTINIPDPNVCKAQFSQCFLACFTKFEQSVGIIAKRSISGAGPLIPRVESTANLIPLVRIPKSVKCRSECHASNEECLYSEAYCADSLKDCLDSCNSKHGKVKARDGLDSEARDEIEHRDVYIEDCAIHGCA